MIGEVKLIAHNNISTTVTMYHNGIGEFRCLSRNIHKLGYHTNQHIYIIDRKCPIKKDDWYYSDKHEAIFICKSDDQVFEFYESKIITTTDKLNTVPRLCLESIDYLIDMYNINDCEFDRVKFKCVEKNWVNEKNCDTCHSLINDKCRDGHGTISCRGLHEYNYWKPKKYYDIPKVLQLDENGCSNIIIPNDKIYTRADMIHAFTSGHNKAKSGLTHGDALMEYKKEQKL